MKEYVIKCRCNVLIILKEVDEMSKYQKRTVYISIGTLSFFLALSLVTHHWGFFLWSLLPVFMVLMSAFFTNIDKNSKVK